MWNIYNADINDNNDNKNHTKDINYLNEILITENVSYVWLSVQITKSHNGNNEIELTILTYLF